MIFYYFKQNDSGVFEGIKQALSNIKTKFFLKGKFKSFNLKLFLTICLLWRKRSLISKILYLHILKIKIIMW